MNLGLHLGLRRRRSGAGAVSTTFGTTGFGTQDNTGQDAKGNIFQCKRNVTVTQIALYLGSTTTFRMIVSEVDAGEVVTAVPFDEERTMSVNGIETFSDLSIALTSGNRYAFTVYALAGQRPHYISGSPTWENNYGDPNGNLVWSKGVYNNVDPGIISSDLTYTGNFAYLMEITYEA